MATATLKTAAATQAILDNTVASAAVNGDGDLILTKHDGSTVNAGSVIGPAGPTGATGEVSSAALAAAITASKDDAGYGILGHDRVGTAQFWAFDENGWNEITDLSVTFNQVTGRMYEVAWGLQLKSGADDVFFQAEARDGSTIRGTASGFATQNGRACSLGGVGHWLAASSGSKTIKLWGRGDTPNDISTSSEYFHTWLSVKDIGVI